MTAPRSHPEFALRSRRVLLAGAKELAPACLWIRDGKIARVATDLSSFPDVVTPILDLGNQVILPGIVDTHAHINEPGRTEWEGFETATRAAAAGGITTVIDMPLNSIPATTSLNALETKAASAQGHCAIDYGFWGGVVPGNTSELEPMIQAGAFGFKAFLCPSGVDEFEMARERDLRAAMPILARHGIPRLVHAELESALPAAAAAPNTYRSYLQSRPPSWEVEAIRLVIRLARETGCRTHIVHLSASDALADLIEARRQGVPITAETCPHYLTFTAESIADGATHFKCAPPIRENANREKLWDALKDGRIEFIVSDHSPCTPALKCLESGDFGKAWGGIAGLQFSLPAVWTEMKARGFSIAELSRLMSQNTARFLGLDSRKGTIAEGLDADLVVLDPDQAFKPESAQVLHRHALTPYTGRELFGRVDRTFVRGHCVYDSGKFEDRPSGGRLTRPAAPAQKGNLS
jgi:allantoinase